MNVSWENANPFSSFLLAYSLIRSRAISFILLLVFSFIRSHAPVPNLLIRGGSPSFARYLANLCRACMLTKRMSSF